MSQPTTAGEQIRTPRDPNALAPELALDVENLYAYLGSEAAVKAVAEDPAMSALHIQTLNHLRHVRFEYEIDDDSPDYTHDYVLNGQYPDRPSRIAVAKGAEFVEIIGTTEVELLPFEKVDEAREADLYAQQKAIAESITRSPLESYSKFAERIATGGEQASFPEFAPTVELLRARLVSNPQVQSVCSNSPQMEKFRQLTLERVDGLLGNSKVFCPYTDTILVIERATEFFDIANRAVLGTSAPRLYHSGRYEYYLHYLLAQPDHIIFPTASALGATDLIRVRGVPIGFIGVNTGVERVDGFEQTPYEFFHHDVNHSRRMFQFFSEAARQQGLSVSKFATISDAFVHNDLLPLVLLSDNDTPEERNHKIAVRMLLFEILHEDALPAHPEIMAEAIMRPALMRTPFEKIEDNKVVYFMEPGATTLAYVFRKLAHTFYDTPEQRFNALGDEESRSRWEIVKAAIEVYRTVSNDPISDEQLVRMLEQLVVTDEGFPEAFFDEVLQDMQQRAEAEGRKFTFLVSKPEDPESALSRIRAFGKKVHTLFGYSGLGYQDERQLMATIECDLRHLDPKNTIIAIGATPEGIGAGYGIAKAMGFFTLGIVSSKSIVHGGRYSEAVDEIVIVKDTEWGGYLPGSEEKMTPTTQVFVEASDSIAAYGGGEITAVSIEEALKKGMPVAFKPFTMKAENNGVVSQGPAHSKWQTLQGRK